MKDGDVKYAIEIQIHDMPESEDTTRVSSSCIPWDDDEHPWETLGIATLDNISAPETSGATRYNVKNAPDDTLVVTKAASVDDPNAVPLSMADWYSSVTDGPDQEQSHKKRTHYRKVDYMVYLVTGEAEGSNQQFELSVAIIGELFYHMSRFYILDYTADHIKRSKHEVEISVTII